MSRPPSRIYVVTDTDTNWKTLVETDSRNQATAAVTAGRYVAKPATPLEVAELMAKGTVFLRPKKLTQPDLPEINPADVPATTEVKPVIEAVPEASL